jgi:fido (protein-threonine AMPylation protein)
VTDTAIPPFRDIYWDDDLEKAPLARAALLLGQSRAELWLRAYADQRSLTLTVVTDLHRVLFEDVWPEFAGKLRGPAPEYLSIPIQFGRYRAVPPEHVPQECTRLFGAINKLIDQLDDLVRDDSEANVLDEVLKIAAYAHCELIRIHPLINGNGRTSRMCINYFAWRYGFAPLTCDRPGDESAYLAANQTWLDRTRIEDFVEFLHNRVDSIQ